MNSISWKDVAHYGSAVACLLMAGLSELGVQLPGVTVDPKIAGAAGIGILAAGLKGGLTSGKAAIAFLMLSAAALLVAPAHAADVAKAPAYSIPSVPCEPTACTGPYGGGFIAGNGTNANIIGNGIDGSVFAGGIDPGLDVGWQYASGDYLLGIEGMFGYEFASLAQVNNVGGNVNGMFGIIQAKAGLALSSLFGSQPALNISLPLPVIAPYVAVGEMIQQKGGTGNVSGAGIEFATPADNLFLDVEYLYGGGTATNTGLTTSTSNMIFMKVNRTF